jgi:putative transposase
MLTGIVLKAHPTNEQKETLSQWMGSAKFIWNAKCDENDYLCCFARKYLPVGTFPEIDQTFSQYKNETLSPWLFKCPSQILRNSASCWYTTYKNFIKGLCGKPKRKRKSDSASVHLTKELFFFEKENGVMRLFIGTKRNNIGFLRIKMHKSFNTPNSLRIKRKNGCYTVSFCYEDGVNEEKFCDQKDHLKYLKEETREKLKEITIGIDRGIKRPVQAGVTLFDLTIEQKKKKNLKDRYIKKCQKRLAKQSKTSKRRRKTKQKIAKAHQKIANIRKDFCHKTSRSIVDNEKHKVIVLEDLKTQNMTKKPAPKKDPVTGKWAENKRKSKADLNKSILDKNWFQFETYLKYKAYRAQKALFKVPAHYTSQECADCGHTHPDNRKTQENFVCGSCGHSENADKNAAEVIKKRAINLILHSGTELSSRGVLLDSGRGATCKTPEANATGARGKETSKKKKLAVIAA